jgi:hypothetical protein
MSRSDLEHAYRDGRLSRRKFIQGMTALGVSIAAANRMADQVFASNSDSAHASKHVDDVYDGGHKPKPPASQVEAGGQVTALPSTGSGEQSGAPARSKLLGLMSASAAVVALGIQRLRKTQEETE